MSHVTAVAGVEITDLAALRFAIAMNPKLEWMEGQSTYRSWISDHGRLVGDYPVPKGFVADELGKNAAHVIRLKDVPTREGYGAPYELGVVESKEKPGTYVLVYDFFAGGYGLEKEVGTKCEDLLMWYRMQCDRLEAEAQGDEIEFQQAKDGTWTSTINTQARLGV